MRLDPHLRIALKPRGLNESDELRSVNDLGEQIAKIEGVIYLKAKNETSRATQTRSAIQ